MTKDHIKEVLDRVLTWPPERQADIVHVVEMMEEQFGSELHLTDEQAAGVEETSAAIEQMTASIAQNTENAKVTDTMASKASSEATEGGE